MATRQQKYIYWVKFKEAPLRDNTTKDFFFGSITAIFSVFPERIIGTNKGALWQHGLSEGNTYYGQFCQIIAAPIIHNPQKNAK